MKCPRCWSDKAYLRPVRGTQQLLFKCALLVPMKCQHCYHKFTVSWFATIRKQIHPPALRIAPISRGSRPSYAARHFAATRNRSISDQPVEDERPRRADAA